MRTNLILIISLLIITFSCKREWENPYDDDCPKEIFTPREFTVEQIGDSIVLKWEQSNDKINGFYLQKAIEEGNFIEFANVEKTTRSITDINIVGGVHYKYMIYAFAGDHFSNSSISEITPVLNPQITTTVATNITTTSAIVGGNITNDGGALVTERGICFNTKQNPTTSNNKVVVGSGIGGFNTTISGLLPNTTYYARSYAINSRVIAYGNEINLKTLSETVTDIDGNVYQTVTIGTQVWMKENLKVTKYSNGDIIGTTIPANLNINTENAPKYQWVYNGYENNVETNGRLYTWYTAIDNRKICPAGWHLPTDEEWTKLSDALGGYKVAGDKLKEVGTNHWVTPNSGTNESGFQALPGGYRSSEGNFYYLHYFCYFWGSTQINNTAISLIISYDDNALSFGNELSKDDGLSVRCLKDN